MKNYFISALLIFSFFATNAQRNRGYDVGSNGVLSDSRLLDIFENIKNRVTTKTVNMNQIKGSPYFDESFKQGEIEYFGETLKENIFLRFNAFSDEMEMSPNPLAESTENILIKNNKVSCSIEGETYRYLGYIADNQPPAVGYLKELFKGNVLALYERKAKVYMEATQARTSLERSFPARFVDKTEYYYSINNGSLLQVKLSKKKLISVLKPYSASIKTFLENQDSKLKSLEEVIQLFSFLDQV